ncbi:hypothetical protein ABFS82_04G024800 [Erythranthe guttata]
MEYQGFVPPPIIVLKVTDICCKQYQKKLKKELSKLDGVYSIDINPEKSLCSVRGKVDPQLILKAVYRTGKYAEIVCSDSTPSSSENRRNPYRKENNNCHNKVGEEQEEEEVHRCEDYVPPSPIDEPMCRDYYGRSHDRMRPNVRGGAPHASGYYPGFHGRFPHPHRARGPTMYDPRWFEEAPPPPGYGFFSGRHWPGFGSYGSFGYESGGNCIIM